MLEKVQSLKRKCQIDVMDFLILTGLFPIYMHSILKFKLKFSGDGIKDIETSRRARRSELCKCLKMCGDLSEERCSLK